MHHSRLCAVLIDCKTSDVDEAARFWGEALGRPVDPSHPGSRGNYRMLETPPDEPIVQIQRVDHESRVHIDIETDDIPAEVTRLRKTQSQGYVRIKGPRQSSEDHPIPVLVIWAWSSGLLGRDAAPLGATGGA